MILVDSHCHLYLLKDKEIDFILKESKLKNVKYILSVSTKLSDFLNMRKIFRKYRNIFYSCGVHPLNLKKNYSFDQLCFLASNKEAIAIGETGLDYFYTKENIIFQQKVFLHHIFLSCELNKPLIVHTRKAKQDTYNMLKKEKNNNLKGVIHCFSYDKNVLRLFLDLGFYISFSGMVTFDNAENIRESAIFTPLDRILIETDSPYLTPKPYRGKENNSSYLLVIANFLAKLKKVNIIEFAAITTQNFCDLFKLKL